MWFYAKDGEQHGPVEADDIRSRLSSGDLSNGTLVWKEGMSQWSPLGEVLELREPVPSGGGQSAPTASAAANPYSPPTNQMGHSAPQLVAPVQQNTMAMVSMILGIISVVMCGGAFTGIPAIVCGHMARKQFRESPVPQTGEGMATAGLILGYLMTVLTLVYVIFVAVAFIGAASSASSMPAPSPVPVP